MYVDFVIKVKVKRNLEKINICFVYIFILRFFFFNIQKYFIGKIFYSKFFFYLNKFKNDVVC